MLEEGECTMIPARCNVTRQHIAPLFRRYLAPRDHSLTAAKNWLFCLHPGRTVSAIPPDVQYLFNAGQNLFRSLPISGSYG